MLVYRYQVWSFFSCCRSDSGVGWDPVHLWAQMGGLARGVVILMFLMSAWSIGVMIDRFMAYNARARSSPRVRSGRGRRVARRQAG